MSLSHNDLKFFGIRFLPIVSDAELLTTDFLLSQISSVLLFGSIVQDSKDVFKCPGKKSKFVISFKFQRAAVSLLFASFL